MRPNHADKAHFFGPDYFVICPPQDSQPFHGETPPSHFLAKTKYVKGLSDRD